MSDESAQTLEWYAAPGMMTDPQKYAALFDGLPTDIVALCQVVQGLMIHIFWAARYGLQLPEARKQEVQLRSVARRLVRILELDSRPLKEPRPLENKVVGNCRDYSTLLSAILRNQGVPARARCGFGRYFKPNHYEDHWICEYFNATRNRWVMVDAQLDAFQCETLQVQFDPLDVPRDQFIVGGKAWQMCRRAEADPESFGIHNMHGLWFVRGDFVRDVASLNKVELLPWDSWGLVDRKDEEMTEDDLALLDRVAGWTCGNDIAFVQVRNAYENDERLRVPPIITTYLDRGARKIEFAKEIGG
jgi:hypothetical protein